MTAFSVLYCDKRQARKLNWFVLGSIIVYTCLSIWAWTYHNNALNYQRALGYVDGIASMGTSATLRGMPDLEVDVLTDMSHGIRVLTYSDQDLLKASSVLLDELHKNMGVADSFNSSSYEEDWSNGFMTALDNEESAASE